MSTLQFADSAFNGIMLVHALFKLLALLLAAPLLQKVVVSSLKGGFSARCNPTFKRSVIGVSALPNSPMRISPALATT